MQSTVVNRSARSDVCPSKVLHCKLKSEPWLAWDELNRVSASPGLNFFVPCFPLWVRDCVTRGDVLSLTSAVLSWQNQRWRANWSDKPLSSLDWFLWQSFNCCPLGMHRKKQRECPNPLYLKWLEEWRDEAKQKNSKLQYTYAKVREQTTNIPQKLHLRILPLCRRETANDQARTRLLCVMIISYFVNIYKYNIII